MNEPLKSSNPSFTRCLVKHAFGDFGRDHRMVQIGRKCIFRIKISFVVYEREVQVQPKQDKTRKKMLVKSPMMDVAVAG